MDHNYVKSQKDKACVGNKRTMHLLESLAFHGSKVVSLYFNVITMVPVLGDLPSMYLLLGPGHAILEALGLFTSIVPPL